MGQGCGIRGAHHNLWKVPLRWTRWETYCRASWARSSWCMGCSHAVKTAVAGTVRSARDSSVPREVCVRMLAYTRVRGHTSASSASGRSAKPPRCARMNVCTPERSPTSARSVGGRSHSRQDFALTEKHIDMTREEQEKVTVLFMSKLKEKRRKKKNITKY